MNSASSQSLYFATASALKIVEIIFPALERTFLGDGADDAHALLPPGKDVRQHVAKPFISLRLDAFLPLLPGQVEEAFDIRPPFLIDVFQCASLVMGMKASRFWRCPGGNKGRIGLWIPILFYTKDLRENGITFTVQLPDKWSIPL
jgi:hypothetical protein